MHPLFTLDGKIALVTGGTGALGGAMCRALAQAGAAVIVCARRAEPAQALAAELGGECCALPLDVQDADSLRRAADEVERRFGRLDVLVNAAGGNQPAATALPGQRSFFELDPAALRHVVDLNLMGTVLPSQVFGALMARQGSGSIINISSMAAFQPLTRVVAYAAAKAAVNNFTQWLAVTLATEVSPRLRVNAIAPGFFMGDQNRFLLQNEDGTLTPRGQQIIDHTPMKRFGQPDDLSGALLWLASDASRFVTGVVVPVDGGFSAYSGV
jgi:NAD(P)-dependent dehydrogenase (short-subunit alcohol dehydrogenase family)